ncbi:unnamed protein product [Bursaphelenchus okinawaensis]|uniref:Uncharacterized protein n=1 Tax=Bursaphelenchus okinawaensis TaxID=465554 RepID=A0A811LWQ5_9BILA|nr:unnamed protein product [Bursaphelenchus okinawaensis]CAG9128492.1 unnamed protein product [Bursaphelenchus okinawaensis]
MATLSKLELIDLDDNFGALHDLNMLTFAHVIRLQTVVCDYISEIAGMLFTALILTLCAISCISCYISFVARKYTSKKVKPNTMGYVKKIPPIGDDGKNAFYAVKPQ